MESHRPLGYVRGVILITLTEGEDPSAACSQTQSLDVVGEEKEPSSKYSCVTLALDFQALAPLNPPTTVDSSCEPE